MNEKRSAVKRFGGTVYLWNCGGEEVKETKTVVGQIITGEAAGAGFAMFPWILDKYERVLRLRPGESWLLRRLLKHAWEFRKPVYVSLRRMTLEANVTRTTLQTYMRRLEELHYVHVISDGQGPDRRRRYDVSGVYVALALCIAADPTSKQARSAKGTLSEADVQCLYYGLPHSRTRVRFDLDFAALADLARRSGVGLGDADDGLTAADDDGDDDEQPESAEKSGMPGT